MLSRETKINSHHPVRSQTWCSFIVNGGLDDNSVRNIIVSPREKRTYYSYSYEVNVLFAISFPNIWMVIFRVSNTNCTSIVFNETHLTSYSFIIIVVYRKIFHQRQPNRQNVQNVYKYTHLTVFRNEINKILDRNNICINNIYQLRQVLNTFQKVLNSKYFIFILHNKLS